MDSDLGKAGRWSVLGDDVTGKGFVKKKEPTNVEGTSCDTEAAWPWPWRYHKSGTDSSNTCATLASGAGLEITAPKKVSAPEKRSGLPLPLLPSGVSCWLEWLSAHAFNP